MIILLLHYVLRYIVITIPTANCFYVGMVHIFLFFSSDGVDILCCAKKQDPRDYFDTQQANALKTLDNSRTGTEQTKRKLTTEEAYGSLKESISKIKSIGLSNSTVKPEVAITVIQSLLQVFFKISVQHTHTHSHVEDVNIGHPLFKQK